MSAHKRGRRQKKPEPGQKHRQERSQQGVPETSVWQDLGALLLKVIIVAVCFVLLFSFIFGIFRNGEISMKPAVKDGDLVIYYRLDKNFVASDAVVFRYQGQQMTGRVIAVAGDTVDISEDGLMVNGAYQQESELDLIGETKRFAEGVDFPLTVPDGQVFLLGDNREGATDSRIFGAVKKSDCKGKIMAIIRRRNV